MHYNFATVHNLNNISATEEIGYVQFAKDCWHKPIYIGLPLVPLAVLLMAFDILVFIISGLWYIFTKWGKIKENSNGRND